MGARGRVLLLALLILAPGACAARFDVDGSRALERVRRQVEMGPRIPGEPGHAAMIAWLSQELSRLGARVEKQSETDTTTGRPLALTNLVGRFGPERGRRILLCAHWDTRPWCDQDPDSSLRNQPLPGANDAGSGVAVLLEVAELMHRRAPRVTVDLVFLDGEDQGTPENPGHYSLGARAYARRASAAGASPKPVAAFVFDMVGDRDLDIHPELQSLQRAANLVGLVLDGARATGARHFSTQERYTLIDDHIPLLDAGIPAVDIIDFDYPAWHTHRDLPDQVSGVSLAEVSRVAAWLVFESPLAKP
jgi:hypothetical protein